MGWLILFQMIWITIRIHVSFKAPPPNDLLPWSQPVHFAGERNCLQQKIVLNHVAKFHYRYHFHVVLNNARKKIFLSLRKKTNKELSKLRARGVIIWAHQRQFFCVMSSGGLGHQNKYRKDSRSDSFKSKSKNP